MLVRASGRSSITHQLNQRRVAVQVTVVVDRERASAANRLEHAGLVSLVYKQICAALAQRRGYSMKVGRANCGDRALQPPDSPIERAERRPKLLDQLRTRMSDFRAIDTADGLVTIVPVKPGPWVGSDRNPALRVYVSSR